MNNIAEIARDLTIVAVQKQSGSFGKSDAANYVADTFKTIYEILKDIIKE